MAKARTRVALLPVACALLLSRQASTNLVPLGPSFVVEPPSRVQFAASAGVRVHCAAGGDPPPTLTWIGEDGAPLDDRPSRRVYSNGTLEMLPAGAYGGGASAATVRCRAANAHGVALSRDVTLMPVADTNWEAVLRAEPAAEGGVAALTCTATHDASFVKPAVWYRGDRVLHVDKPRPDSPYVIAGDRLLIGGVAAGDAGAYGCLARHALTATTKRAAPALLAVTTGRALSAPRLISAVGEVTVSAGADFCLPCVASDQPPPQYTWYRESEGRLQAVEAAEAAGAWLWAGGAALCFARVAAGAGGAWLCKAFNAHGDATAHVRLTVLDHLSVTVAPKVIVAATGSSVRFRCSASNPSATLTWLHDGVPAGVGAGADLVVGGAGGVTRAHRGLYQCFAKRAHDAAQATAELRLGDSAPKLHYTFIEQALRPGGGVSLRCAATGSPPPTFSWQLDGQPLDQYRTPHRYFISEETSANGDVVSTLNMSAAAPSDGGRYTCSARNSLGHAHHSARLNIYGPPSIRAVGPVRVVAGANATVHCPYAGYPISSISWWRRGGGGAAVGVGAGAGAGVGVGAGGRVAARGAALVLAPALPQDAGSYACAVAAPTGPAARADIQIQVRNPPKISPFMFSSELTEGSSVQVLCGVSSGDKPMYFSWLKDGAPLPSNLQIEEKSLNEFSLLMFSDLTARHSGEYTCRVSNHAATVNYTATLSVKVAPAWTTEPLDAAVLLGAPLLLECAAKGYPTPTIAWYRKIGEGVAVSGESNEQWEVIPEGQWGMSISDANGSVKARNGSLSSEAASRAHQGLYRCTADNAVGPPLVKQINVTVHEPAHFQSPGRNVSCVRGQTATLTCYALGDSPLLVHWTRRGTKLDLDSYRWTLSEARTSDGMKSTLQLRAAERIDAGEYRCHAHNQYGRSELAMYLHVEEPPEAPKGLKLGGVGSRWVRVVWQAVSGVSNHFTALYTALHSLPGAEPRHNTANLTLEPPASHRVDVDGGRVWAAKLEGLQPASAYSLRLTAANHVGQSPHSEPLLFTTLEEAPTSSPQNVRVRPANPGELHISWSAPSQDSWNGELLGYVASWREVGGFDNEHEDDSSRRDGNHISPGWSSTELTISNLRSFVRYAVTLRAYNLAGAGPPSPIVYGTTADGVPEVPPNSVTCESISARSLRIRWAPLPVNHVHALRGYDLRYAPLHFSSSWSGEVESQTVRASLSGEAILQALRAATNYSVWVRARADRGLGPPSAPVYCSTGEDAPEAAEAVRAVAAAADAVRVSWRSPPNTGGRLTHYTLYTRELGKVGGEWSQRVDVSEQEREAQGEGGELWREVRGLRERTLYEFWVRAASAAGAGPPSRPVTAAPAPALSARITSIGRVTTATLGGRARLRCAAVGAPPLRRRWAPLPPAHAHALTDSGDMLIHRVELQYAGNYTCVVRNSGGSDAAVITLSVRRPPSAPIPRLVRTDTHALHLAWDPPPNGGAALLGYTVWWSRESSESRSVERGSLQVPAEERAAALRGLQCGAPHRVALQAHNAAGASPHSPPLLVRTRGDKAKAPPGKEFVWANSTCLRLNLLAWGGRCPVARWALALRPARGGPWADLRTDGEAAQASNLRPGSWYEIRVLAKSPAGDTNALYKAATHTQNGERLGEAVEVPVEGVMSAAEGGEGAGGGGGAGAGAAAWRGGLAPALTASALAALLAALAGLAVARRRGAPPCVRRRCSLGAAPALAHAHSQLYSTEPGKRNGKALTPPDGDLHEISPYATFSMSGGAGGAGGVVAGAGAGAGGGGGGGCALHLRTFACAEALDLAAPPPRPNLLTHPSEYGRSRDSDSESSGSPCAACAAQLYRLPAARLADTLPAVESSAESTSYSGGGRASGGPRPRPAGPPPGGDGGGGGRGARPPPKGRRRREHARQPSGPTIRYSSDGGAQPRQRAL